MQMASPLHPAESFAVFMATLIKAVCNTIPESLTGPVKGRLWSRLMRLRNRFADILRKAREGHYENLKPRAPRTRPAKPPEPKPPPLYPHLEPPPLPPGGYPALLRLLPEFYAYRGQFEHTLARPDMQALLQATPQLRRAINPLCRMLRIKPLANPNRQPRQAATAEPTTTPKPRRILPPRPRPTPAVAPLRPRPPPEPDQAACGPPILPMIGVWPPEIVPPIFAYLNAMKTRQ
jgi:hypothetical protein